MEVINYIYDTYNERGCKRFEQGIKKELKYLDAKEVICRNAWWERDSGYNSYFVCAEIDIDGLTHTIKAHTHNSEGWDNWINPTAKDKRKLFWQVIASNKIEIDLFEYYTYLPENVTQVIDKYEGDYMDYKICEAMLKELNAFGYTFDYGLDAEPFNLRRI